MNQRRNNKYREEESKDHERDVTPDMMQKYHKQRQQNIVHTKKQVELTKPKSQTREIKNVTIVTTPKGKNQRKKPSLRMSEVEAM